LLIPNHVAGAIIGKGGMLINHMKATTGCHLRISAANCFFPGTDDRILLMGGCFEALQACLQLVLQRFQDSLGRPPQPLRVKLVVPNSSVSALIGTGGSTARRLSSDWDCRLHISTRVEGLKERHVLLLGASDNVVNATFEVCKLIQSDPHLAEHHCLNYDIQLPMGIWEDFKGAPQPDTPLITPEEACLLTKREILQYLRMSAPHKFLTRRGLLGNIENRLKCKGRKVFIEAVADTYLERQGQLPNPANDNADLAATEVAVELHSLHSRGASNCQTEEFSDRIWEEEELGAYERTWFTLGTHDEARREAQDNDSNHKNSSHTMNSSSSSNNDIGNNNDNKNSGRGSDDNNSTNQQPPPTANHCQQQQLTPTNNADSTSQPLPTPTSLVSDELAARLCVRNTFIDFESSVHNHGAQRRSHSSPPIRMPELRVESATKKPSVSAAPPLLSPCSSNASTEWSSEASDDWFTCSFEDESAVTPAGSAWGDRVSCGVKRGGNRKRPHQDAFKNEMGVHVHWKTSWVCLC
jgi:hypothetical protein